LLQHQRLLGVAECIECSSSDRLTVSQESRLAWFAAGASDAHEPAVHDGAPRTPPAGVKCCSLHAVELSIAPRGWHFIHS